MKRHLIQAWAGVVVGTATLFAATLNAGKAHAQTAPTFTQSSLYRPGVAVGSAANLSDRNTTTGAGTGSGASWIGADWGAPVQVSSVTLGAGNLSGWGSVSTYLNGAVLQYSNDGQTWTDVLTVSGMTNGGSWVRGNDARGLLKTFTFAPITARYWRLSRSGYLATSEFTFNDPAPAAIATPYTSSQSSVYRPNLAGTYATLTDGDRTTGAATNSGSSWIAADFGSSVAVHFLTVGGGSLPNWGSVVNYLNGATLQYSADGQTWTTALTVTQATDSSPLTLVLPTPTTARYWRLSRSGYLATTELQFWGATTTPTPSPAPSPAPAPAPAPAPTPAPAPAPAPAPTPSPAPAPAPAPSPAPAPAPTPAPAPAPAPSPAPAPAPAPSPAPAPAPAPTPAPSPAPTPTPTGVQVYRDAEERLYIEGLQPRQSVHLVYGNLFRRVSVRTNPDRCNLAQFWQSRRFRLYSREGTTIYLPQGGTLHFNYDRIPQATGQVCVNGQLAAGLPWVSLGNGVQAIAADVTGWNRAGDTFMILVRGLPSQGVYATDHTRARRYGRANSCGVLRYSSTANYDNGNLGSFYYAIGNSSSSAFNWATVPIRQAPPLCYRGVLYRPG